MLRLLLVLALDMHVLLMSAIKKRLFHVSKMEFHTQALEYVQCFVTIKIHQLLISKSLLFFLVSGSFRVRRY